MQVQEMAPGVYLVPIPIPVPLKTVNCYALRGSQGWTLVDCGFNDQPAAAAWLRAMGVLGIAPQDVEQIVVTHAHPDHIGMAGRLQQWTQAPVLMHEREIPLVSYWWDPACLLWSEYERFCLRHGMPAERVQRTGSLQRRITGQMVGPLPTRITPVRTGEPLQLGTREFIPFWMPGHTEGLMVLWNAADAILLADDLILADISPNISVWPGLQPNPLAVWLQSLDSVRRLPARLVLTGHRGPVVDLADRSRQLTAHHLRRIHAVEQIVAQGSWRRRGLSAWAVSGELWGALHESDLHAAMFAMGEAVAHLEYLVAMGRLIQTEVGTAAVPAVTYRPRPARVSAPLVSVTADC